MNVGRRKMKLFGKRKSYNWKQEHQRLWDAHVPPSGAADTLQGELVRIVGKLVDQAYRNGNGNWDADHETMWRFVAAQITADLTFDDKDKASIRDTVEEIIRDEACPDLSGDGSTYYRVNGKVVDWCMAHPDPIPFESDGSYTR
jgi:hypothetical protein